MPSSIMYHIVLLLVFFAKDASATRALFQHSAIHSTSPLQPTSKSRNVYFDLGANWANTLRLYKEIADPDKAKESPWEVYAFEASPLIVPYLSKFIAWLNGKSAKPELLWPPAGSSGHLRYYAKRYGCPESPEEQMRECMWLVFEEPLQHMVPDRTLMTPANVRSAVAQAAFPPTDDKDRFVLVPGAAGATAGTLHLGHVDAQSMIRGGALDESEEGKEVDVPVADFVTMLTQNFRESDYVVVKMDIEGGEFDVLRKLMATGAGNLIDVLMIECHVQTGEDCPGILEQWKKSSSGKLLTEGSVYYGDGYKGWDAYSSPDKYYPVDPRTAA